MKPPLRSKARRYALQALYQWHMSDQPVADVLIQFHDNISNDVLDDEYFLFLVNGVAEQVSALDQRFEPYLDRKLHDLTPIELTVLRLASFELTNSMDVPYRVVINEALELTKEFGSSDEGFKYVNAILDKVKS